MMRSRSLAVFLKEGLLYDEVLSRVGIFERIFLESLGETGNGKTVLIVTDKGYPQRRIAPMLAYGYYVAAQKKGLNPRLYNVFDNNRNIKESVYEAIANIPNESIIIFSLSDKLKNSGSLSKIIRSRGHKKITSTGLSAVKSNFFNRFMDVCNVDYLGMHKIGLELKHILDVGNNVRIRTLKGTDVTFSIKARKAISNDGYYISNNGGNMPVGEVFIAPEEEETNGIIVIDGSIRTLDKTFLINNPIRATIRRGKLISLEGGKGAELLMESLREAETSANGQGARIIGELGIGINPRAKVIGPTIVNEKSLGTFHVAFGSNYYFGGKNRTNIHVDQVILNPIIEVDNKRIEIYKKK